MATLDTRQHQPQYHTMGYDPMRYAQPQFTDPWGTAAPAQPQLYAPSLPQPPMPMPNVSAAYSSAQLPATAMATDAMSAPRPYGASYAPIAQHTTAALYPAMTAMSVPQYSAETLQRTSPYGYDRRPSHPLQTATEAERQGFSDALDASRGMVAMSQSDITPRNIYGNQQQSTGRASSDSYGFPQSHSSHSSISSGSGYQNHYSSSVSEYSVGDYSSASEDLANSRTLPRPSGLIGGALPPAPQSMMGQFSSKVSSSSQKKHKCKVCDKRFTRPSSLQTHMYSHTGEKPFACDVDGCGRHFSVVSNLRRHRKVHKGDGHDHPSPDDDE